MSNFKDQNTGMSRFLNLKNENKSENKILNKESQPKTIPLHENKSPITREQRPPVAPISTPASTPISTPASTTISTPASTPRSTPASTTTPTPTGQEQKKPLFPQRNGVDNSKEQKPSGLRSPSTLFTKPAATTPNSTASSTANPVIANPALSFKERLEALQKKQAEARAATPPKQTESALSTKTPFGNKSAVATIFGEKKQAPLFTATRLHDDKPAAARPDSIVPAQVKNDYKISDNEFTQLRDFLYDQSGIFVAENRKYLMENRLSSRLRELGLRNFDEYHNYLRFDNNRMTELNKLFENMTTNETSFFRNNPQLDIFRDQVLLRIINEQRAKGQKKIHIWSAGCSSGEEPYTISIILHELLKTEIGTWNIKITANDLSLAMLATAQKGLYSEYALRTTPQNMIDKYFTKEGKMFKILPKIQNLVKFGQINLASTPQLSKVERSHIVFCRNVIIYFDDEMKRHVINAFYDNLLPGGFLLIGHSESLHSISRAFVPEHFTGAIVYGKKS